ncbi:transporter substrate-binding domain-containing protein [Marinobacter sp. CHS3-4]|uniref:transporter substrate-binding domain-containing protein n=1 Tax=Marinobacter sp. CHS3-4 TaxID=3045174 RepID=UPI0024B5AE8A|nr:transporter substrate-binding domain-containing protein [Marinobacter sp. CHS3-4]MDI9245403.1 transporter substrate-binding domain-containing protein [Marinobacter sp. CHS3-4]
MQALEVKADQIQDPDRFLLWYRNYDSPPVRALVKLAFEKTPEYGPYTLARSTEMSQGRAIRELKNPESDLLDIINVASDSRREKELSAIPIPIDGGLLGLRVCVVRKDDLKKFEGIKTIQDLSRRDIRIGQGTHWPDTSILKVNGVQVVTHSRYEILFRMLDNDRFDCFARGVSEVLYDLRLENNPEYVVEPGVLIAYPMPSFFFVSRDDFDAAHRLQLGMERAILDGSFANYLDRYYGQAIEELNLGERNVLVLDNPFLGQESWDIGQRTLQELRERIEQMRE